jgi:phosphoglycerol transferase MdoB-like AlkP superfamily enzyme
VGIFLGWIIQKRWMTIIAVVLTVVGTFTLPRLGSPFSYTVLVLPVLLAMATIFESVSLPGLGISRQLRLALTLWIGFGVVVLLAGIVFAGSNSSLSVAAIATASVLMSAGVITIAAMHRRQVRHVQTTATPEQSNSETTPA